MRDLLREYEKDKAALSEKYIEMIKAQDLFLTIRRMCSERMQQTEENADGFFEYGTFLSYGKRFMRTVSFPPTLKTDDAYFETELLKAGFKRNAGLVVLNHKSCLKDFNGL